MIKQRKVMACRKTCSKQPAIFWTPGYGLKEGASDPDALTLPWPKIHGLPALPKAGSRSPKCCPPWIGHLVGRWSSVVPELRLISPWQVVSGLTMSSRAPRSAADLQKRGFSRVGGGYPGRISLRNTVDMEVLGFGHLGADSSHPPPFGRQSVAMGVGKFGALCG